MDTQMFMLVCMLAQSWGRHKRDTLCQDTVSALLPNTHPLVLVQDMEAAADFSKQRKNWELAHTCYWEAANLYMSGGRHTAGGWSCHKGSSQSRLRSTGRT